MKFLIKLLNSALQFTWVYIYNVYIIQQQAWDIFEIEPFKQFCNQPNNHKKSYIAILLLSE